MIENSQTKELEKIISLIKKAPYDFFKNNQNETTQIEYKTTFALDSAMNGCPYLPEDKNNETNDALSLKIFETIVAFANTYGGILVIGVSESGHGIISEDNRKKCEYSVMKKVGLTPPCVEKLMQMTPIIIGKLNIHGIEKELKVSHENDVDRFQRHIESRFAITGNKNSILFKPKTYPCDKPSSKEYEAYKITPSEGFTSLNYDMFQVSVNDTNGKEKTLVVISVKESTAPIHLTKTNAKSQNISYVFPVRKTGKTDCEKDPRAIHKFIEEKFDLPLAQRLIKELQRASVKTASLSFSEVTENNVVSFARSVSKIWKDSDFAYPINETDAKQLLPFISDISIWKDIADDALKAYLLIVSIHFGTGWEKWTLLNSDNEIAISSLFSILHYSYWRTRFRSLYALQFVDKKILDYQLNLPENSGLSEKTVDTIKQYVCNNNTVSFIKEIAVKKMGGISSKANSVLTEIALLWDDKRTGVDVPL